MLKVSENQFAKKTPTTSGNSFAAGTDLPESSNKFSANKFSDPDIKIGGKAWEGQNTSDAGLGGDFFRQFHELIEYDPLVSGLDSD